MICSVLLKYRSRDFLHKKKKVTWDTALRVRQLVNQMQSQKHVLECTISNCNFRQQTICNKANFAITSLSLDFIATQPHILSVLTGLLSYKNLDFLIFVKNRRDYVIRRLRDLRMTLPVTLV